MHANTALAHPTRLLARRRCGAATERMFATGVQHGKAAELSTACVTPEELSFPKSS